MNPEIIVRPGRPDDVPFLQTFTRNTFEWGDYVADALEDWLKEPGDLWVAEVQGKPVGVNHVRYLSSDEAWFEGIRVHPDYRRMGVGTRLTEAAIKGARERGAKVARVAIDGDNYKSQAMSRSIGFVPVDELVVFSKDLPAGSANERTPAAADSLNVKTRAKGDVEGITMDEEGIAVVDLSPSDVPLLVNEALRTLKYGGCDYTWRRLSIGGVLTDLADGVRVMAAKDSSGAIRGGTWYGAYFVEPDHERGGLMTVMVELGSIFGDEPAIMALGHWAEIILAEKRDKDGLPAARLFANCRAGTQASSILPRLGFSPDDRVLGIWELEL